MGTDCSFAQQFFAVSSVTSDRRVLLAGGLQYGSRSAYRASIACYDHTEKRVVWLIDQPKCYPFRAITHAGGVCAAMLPQNFVREPTGMFRFDLESGEPIQPVAEVRGWKIDFIDAWGETFLFSWVCDETSFMRAVEGRGAAFQERTFPYHSTAGGKTIERVVATGRETFVAVFSLVKGRRVVYSAERWSLDSSSPSWEKRTSLNDVVRNGSVLMFWRRMEARLDVEVRSMESGDITTSFRLPLANVMAIQPIDADSYAVLAASGAYVLDAAAKTLSQVTGIGPSDLLDFGALAVDASLGKLIVVTAGNFQRPGTRLTVIDL